MKSAILVTTIFIVVSLTALMANSKPHNGMSPEFEVAMVSASEKIVNEVFE
jgi:hypothetical protein